MKLRLWYVCAKCDVKNGAKNEQCVRWFLKGAYEVRLKNNGQTKKRCALW